MDRQARTGNTVLRDNRYEPNTAVVAGRRRDKDDRKQNTLTPLKQMLLLSILTPTFLMQT